MFGLYHHPRPNGEIHFRVAWASDGPFGKIYPMFAVIAFLAAAAIQTAAELGRATERYEPDGRAFDITVQITHPPYRTRSNFFAEDATGAIELNTFPGEWTKIRAGDVYRLKGITQALSNRIGIVHADCDQAEFLRHEPTPNPRMVSANDFLSGRCLFQRVTLDGIMRNVLMDEIDPNYVYFILECGDERVFAVLATNEEIETLSGRFLNTRVSMTGSCTRDADSRAYCDYFLNLRSTQDIVVRERLADDPFAVKDISDTANMTPKVISTLGRRRATGSVLAVWSTDKALIKAEKGWPVLVTLAQGALPVPGSMIEVSGYPETDIYNINLTRAIWRLAESGSNTCRTVLRTSPAELTTDSTGRPRLDAHTHAKWVELNGLVKHIRRGKDDETIFSLEDDGHTVDIVVTDEATARSLAENCRVWVSGVCVMEKEPWRPNSIIPRITGIFIVVNDPKDIRILSRPSWWTPARLLFVIAALLAALGLILAWNAALRALVARRSRQLFRAEIAKADAQLRIDERTRLAAELHDSVAQNLSGVSLQIDAAERLLDGERDRLAEKLHLASIALKSSRVELRNCLWDLRNQALDEPDMNAAILKTLAPHLGDTRLTVRFNIRRATISDNTVHAILRIIRELVSNAIRHGQAKTIRIAGGLDNGRILFSVRDDGCGFDPDNVPGMRQGHFGLPGIRERIRKLNGTLEIASSPNRGSKFTVALEGLNPAEK